MTSEPLADPALTAALGAWVEAREPELIELRRALHAHPELGYAEYRTTELIHSQLRAMGLRPEAFPSGTGAICDLGEGDLAVALRADIDALPIQDTKSVPYRSQVDGVAHACGHDAHAAALLGAAGALASVADGLGGRVRLLFQPAEEQLPGGAVEAVKIGALDGISAIFALHCDPRLDVGTVGLRTGPITAACDKVEVRLSGPGGHTARPQLTADLVYALGKVITEVPGILSRRVDARAGLSVVWGAVGAGVAPNAIPGSGFVRGTVRMLSRDLWDDAEGLVRTVAEQAVAGTGAAVEVAYVRGVPPVVNDPGAVVTQRVAVVAALGEAAQTGTEQSMGGEDFGWYLGTVPGALGRLGVRRCDTLTPMMDLHQGDFDIDERAVAVGARFLAQTALEALRMATT